MSEVLHLNRHVNSEENDVKDFVHCIRPSWDLSQIHVKVSVAVMYYPGWFGGRGGGGSFVCLFVLFDYFCLFGVFVVIFVGFRFVCLSLGGGGGGDIVVVYLGVGGLLCACVCVCV